ncbi:hypothetical protein Tco_1138659 [Tanacetum coccineum]
MWSTIITDGSAILNEVTGANNTSTFGLNKPIGGILIKSTKLVVILGVWITSKEELIGLLDKLEFGALDDVIFGLTIAERDAAHALVLDLARGFNYMNSNSDTPSEELNKDTTSNTGFNSSFSKVNFINDDSTPSMALSIVKSAFIQSNPNSFVGAAGVSSSKPKKVEANFRTLDLENLCDYVDLTVPVKVLEMVSSRFENTLYGYFIGKLVAFSVVEYYVRNNWVKYGLKES